MISDGKDAMRRVGAVSLALFAIAAGCGGDEDGGDVGSTEAASLKPPEQPAARDCAGEKLRTDVKPQSTAPDPGRYTYAVEGTRKELRRSAVAVALPKTAPLFVTPATKIGNVICFRTQIRYTPKQANTVTFAIRGGDFHIIEIDFFVAGQTLTFKPDVPLKAVDGSGTLSWNGTFTGPTKGSFKGTTLGRRPFTFRGRTERAMGIELQLRLSGELRGSNKQRIWISLDRGTLYEQRLEQVQNFGSQPMALDYHAKLRSFDPSQ